MPREKVPVFSNEYCRFKPHTWTLDGGVLKPVVFKVVTEDLRSLGLRGNPNIMTFLIGAWVRLPDDKVVPGNTDWGGWGGIWSALRLTSARALARYMVERHEIQTKVFLTALENPVFANSYRVKSQGVLLLEGIVTG